MTRRDPATAVSLSAHSRRDQTIAAWVAALRRQADAATLKNLPPLIDADAAHVMALLREDAAPESGVEEPTEPGTVIGQFRPRITLQTLGRGDGLLGLKPHGKLAARGGSVTLVQVDWTYRTETGAQWHTPAPTSVLNTGQSHLN